MERATQLKGLLRLWEESAAKGERLSPEQLCQDYPELLAEFRQHIEAHPLSRQQGGDKEPIPEAATKPDLPAGSSEEESGAQELGQKGAFCPRLGCRKRRRWDCGPTRPQHRRFLSAIDEQL